MNSRQDIKPISFVKANTTEVLASVNRTKRPLYITQNGVAKAVLLDTDSFENMKNALSLMKLMTICENECKDGKITQQEDVFSAVEKKFGWGR